MVVRRPLKQQPNLRSFDVVRRVSEAGANEHPTLGLVWRVAGLEDSEDDMSILSEDDELGDDPTPPDNHAQVAWLDFSQELTVESEMKGVDIADVAELVPVDRNLAAGDIVASISDPLGQTGSVVGSHRLLDLQLSDGRIVRSAPLTAVQPVLNFHPEQYVLSNGWLGRIQEVVQMVTVRLLDGTVAQFVCDREQQPVQPMHAIDFLFRDENSCPFYPGQAVTLAMNTPKSQVRILQGKALRCQHGKVLSVSVGSLIVNWISSYGDSHQPPKETVHPEKCVALSYSTFGTPYWHLGTRGLWLESQALTAEEPRSSHTQPSSGQAGSKTTAAPGSGGTAAHGSGSTAVEGSKTAAVEGAAQGRPHRRGRESHYPPRVDTASAAPNPRGDDAKGVQEGSTAQSRRLLEISVMQGLIKARNEGLQARDDATKGSDASTGTEDVGCRGDNAARGNDASAATEYAGRRGDEAARGNDAHTLPLTQQGPAVRPPTFAEVVARQPVTHGAAGHKHALGHAQTPRPTEEGSARQGGGWAASVRSVMAAFSGSRSTAPAPLPASPTGQKRSRRRARNRSKKLDAANKYSEASIPITAHVIGTHTTVDVKWQDGRVETGISAVDVIPRIFFDEHDFWPDDFVEEVPDDLDSTTAPGKQQEKRTGIVMSYNAVARTAEVCWLDKHNYGRPGGTMLRPLAPSALRVTLPVYSILSHPEYSYAIGDVLLRLVPLLSDSEDVLDRFDQTVGELIGFWSGQLEVVWANGGGGRGLVSPDRVCILSADDDEDGPDAADSEQYHLEDENGSWCTASEDSQASEPAEPSTGADGAPEDEKSTVNTNIESPFHGRQPGVSSRDGQSGKCKPPASVAPAAATPSPRRIAPIPIQSLAGNVPSGQDRTVDLTSFPSGASPEGALGITFGSFGSDELNRIVLDSRKKRQAALGADVEAGTPSDAQRPSAGVMDPNARVADRHAKVEDLIAKLGGEPPTSSAGIFNRLMGVVKGNWGPTRQTGTSQEASASGRGDTIGDPMVGTSGTESQSRAIFPHFDVLETVPEDHLYVREPYQPPPKKFQRTVLKEWESLRENLPDSIWVRAFESRMDLLRVCIKGAADTPYHNHLFFFDIKLPNDYPAAAPQVSYISWGLRLNPNLYENGKGLVLVAKPYYNEAGFERQADTAEGELNSRQYNETAFLLTCRSSIYCLRKPPGGFAEFIKMHYKAHKEELLAAVEDVIQGKAGIGGTGIGPNGETAPSEGIRLVLRQLLPNFQAALERS